MTYGLVVWGSTNKTQFENLERMHVRAAKFIFGLDWCTPTEEVRTKYNWKTLKNAYLKLLVILVHKCNYGNAPVPVQELFTKRSSTYNLRNENCLSLPRPKTEVMRKSITYKGSVLWNNIRNESRKLESLNIFKNIVAKQEFLSTTLFG